MPSEPEYERMVASYSSWSRLADFWRRIQERDTPGWDSGKAFEYFVLQMFKLDGGSVRWPFPVTLRDENVEQIDGAVHIGRFSCLVESKHLSTTMSIEPIAKLRNQLLRRHAGLIGLMFSYSGFTEPATILAGYIAPQCVLLWKRDDIEQILEDKKVLIHLEAKYQLCVEEGIPDAGIRKLRRPSLDELEVGNQGNEV